MNPANEPFCAEYLFPRRFCVSGKRQDGFSNFGREAFFFRRRPARASAGVLSRKETLCPAVAP
jgi:hypothetical protein